MVVHITRHVSRNFRLLINIRTHMQTDRQTHWKQYQLPLTRKSTAWNTASISASRTVGLLWSVLVTKSDNLQRSYGQNTISAFSRPWTLTFQPAKCSGTTDGPPRNSLVVQWHDWRTAEHNWGTAEELSGRVQRHDGGTAETEGPPRNSLFFCCTKLDCLSRSYGSKNCFAILMSSVPLGLLLLYIALYSVFLSKYMMMMMMNILAVLFFPWLPCDGE